MPTGEGTLASGQAPPLRFRNVTPVPPSERTHTEQTGCLWPVRGPGARKAPGWPSAGAAGMCPGGLKWAAVGRLALRSRGEGSKNYSLIKVRKRRAGARGGPVGWAAGATHRPATLTRTEDVCRTWIDEAMSTTGCLVKKGRRKRARRGGAKSPRPRPAGAQPSQLTKQSLILNCPLQMRAGGWSEGVRRRAATYRSGGALRPLPRGSRLVRPSIRLPSGAL